jgi:hypothetical protein
VQVLLSIQSLLTDPFCDVCMEPDIGELYLTDKTAFETVARYEAAHFPSSCGNDSYLPEMEVKEIILAKVSRFCQPSSHQSWNSF